MKKIFFLFAIILLSSLGLSAQGFNLGFKVGYNYSNFNIDNVSAKSKSGFMAGAFLKIKANDSFGIQPELLFMRNSGSLTYSDTTIGGTGDFTFNYIQVPIMLVFKPIPILNIQIGPYASYLASINVQGRGITNYDFEKVKKSQFNDWDYGIAGGVGVDFLFVTAGIRYNQGLSKVGNSSNGYVFADGRNSTVTLYAGIQF